MGRSLHHLLRQERLYHNQNGVFTEVARSRRAGSGKSWGTGCAFVDYDRDGRLDLVVANYVDFDLATAPAPGERLTCIWKGFPSCAGRAVWPERRISSITIAAMARLKTSPPRPTLIAPTALRLQRVDTRLRRRRMARHFHRLRQHAQHSLSQQPRWNVHRCRSHFRRSL